MKDNDSNICETVIEIAIESDTELNTEQRYSERKKLETNCSTDTVSNRDTYLHRSPSTGLIQRLPKTDNHKKVITSRSSGALFSSDKDLIGIFTNPSSKNSHSLPNPDSSQHKHTSLDVRISDCFTAGENVIPTHAETTIL